MRIMKLMLAVTRTVIQKLKAVILGQGTLNLSGDSDLLIAITFHVVVYFHNKLMTIKQNISSKRMNKYRLNLHT